jgi:hypothetical protein
MNLFFRYISIFFLLLIFVGKISAQADDFCSESGYTPSLDSPFARIPYIFGRVTLTGYQAGTKFPNVTVSVVDSQQSVSRMTVRESGNYCFRVRSTGTIIIEVDGIEAVRKALPSFGPTQQREDFEINIAQLKKPPPGVISAKFFHPPNPKTAELYKKIIEAESKKDSDKSVDYLKEIVAIDPADFIAWAKLGVLYQAQNQFPEADVAFRKSLELKVEYTPAWINIGMMRVKQKQFSAAIEIFKHAATLEAKSARIYQLLGEAYLQNRQGTLGAEALNQAIELDPIGMAELHLQLAHLYQLAKANKLATKEYKMFLAKVPDYQGKKKLEKFINENPE